MHVVACQKCGAGLPPPDPHRIARCAYCATPHQLGRPTAEAHASRILGEMLAHAAIDRMEEEAARIPMTDDAVLTHLRASFAGADSLYFCPTVPPKKEHGARRVHAGHLPPNEWILALYDDTVFGSGEDGFVVTSRRLCWKNVAERPHMIEWRHLDPERMFADGRKLVLGAGAIEISGDPSVIDAADEAFYVLALSARSPAPTASGFAPAAPSPAPASYVPTLQSPMVQPPPASGFPRASAQATPPPPYAAPHAAHAAYAAWQAPPAFACWHCETPLAWNTAQCSRCGAWPTPQGWLRTA